MDNFIKKVRDEFEDILVSINENTIFKNLDEWDSLTALSIISMIDEEYGVEITDEEMNTAETLRDLFNIILTKKQD